MANLSQPPTTRADRVIPVLIACCTAYLLLLTVSDYGIMWDCWEYYLGDHYLYYFAGLDPAHLDLHADSIPLYQRLDHPDFHAVTTAYADNDVLVAPIMIWPLGVLGAAASKQLFFRALGLFDPFDAANLVLVPYAIALIFAVWQMGRAGHGRWAAVVALLLMLSHPRLWAHLHTNIKDIPTVVWWVLTIGCFVRGIERRQTLWLLLSAAAWGLGLATKANGLFLPLVLGPWFLFALRDRRRRGETWTDRTEVAALVAYPLIGLAIMVALWPLLWDGFPGSLVTFFDSLRARGLRAPAPLDPAAAGSAAAAWQSLPLQKILYTTPPVFLVALAIGLLRIAVESVRHRRLPSRYLLLLLWLVVPVLRVCLPGAYDFDGIRHWLEFIPAAALIAGIGVGPWLDALAVRLGAAPCLADPFETELAEPATAPDSPAPAPTQAGEGEPNNSPMAETAAAIAAVKTTVAETLPTAIASSPSDQVDPPAATALDMPAAPAATGWLRALVPVLLPLALVLLAIAPTVAWMYRHHPYQLVYFNGFIGGFGGAQARDFPDASDYWCNSYRTAFDMLNTNAGSDAQLYLGVAEHLGYYTREVWLRPDIQLRNVVGRSPDEIGAEIRSAPGDVYLLYIHRPSFYNELAKGLDGKVEPVWQVTVDGGIVVTVLQLR